MFSILFTASFEYFYVIYTNGYKLNLVWTNVDWKIHVLCSYGAVKMINFFIKTHGIWLPAVWMFQWESCERLGVLLMCENNTIKQILNVGNTMKNNWIKPINTCKLAISFVAPIFILFHFNLPTLQHFTIVNFNMWPV